MDAETVGIATHLDAIADAVVVGDVEGGISADALLVDGDPAISVMNLPVSGRP